MPKLRTGPMHAGTPDEYFDRPLIEWLTFVPVPWEPKRGDDPSPEEILRLAAAVRAKWTPDRLRDAEGYFPAEIPTMVVERTRDR